MWRAEIPAVESCRPALATPPLPPRPSWPPGTRVCLGSPLRPGPPRVARWGRSPVPLRPPSDPALPASRLGSPWPTAEAKRSRRPRRPGLCRPGRPRETAEGRDLRRPAPPAERTAPPRQGPRRRPRALRSRPWAAVSRTGPARRGAHTDSEARGVRDPFTGPAGASGGGARRAPPLPYARAHTPTPCPRPQPWEECGVGAQRSGPPGPCPACETPRRPTRVNFEPGASLRRRAGAKHQESQGSSHKTRK